MGGFGEGLDIKIGLDDAGDFGEDGDLNHGFDLEFDGAGAGVGSGGEVQHFII